jgi:hypothetical protein
MSSRREGRGPAPRTDAQILATDHDMQLLAAVAAGAITRASTVVNAPFLLDGTPVQLRRLAREDLVYAPISGPPSLQPRGRRLLAIKHREYPTPIE